MGWEGQALSVTRNPPYHGGTGLANDKLSETRDKVAIEALNIC